jgi:hypothetical protein
VLNRGHKASFLFSVHYLERQNDEGTPSAKSLHPARWGG